MTSKLQKVSWGAEHPINPEMFANIVNVYEINNLLSDLINVFKIDNLVTDLVNVFQSENFPQT